MLALVLDIFHDTPNPMDFQDKTPKTPEYDEFLEKIDYFTIVALLHTVFSIVFCIDYYNRLPYYKASTSECYCFCLHSYFWISLVFLICQWTRIPSLTENALQMLVVGLCFFLYIVKKFREYFFRSLLVNEIDELNSEMQLDARFRYLMEISKSSKKNEQDQLVLTSIIKVHTTTCKNVYCICRNRGKLYDPKKKTFSDQSLPNFKDPVFVKNFLLKLITDSKKKQNRSFYVNLDYF